MKCPLLLLAILLLAILLLPAGCASNTPIPAAGSGDPYPAPLNDPQITVLSPELREVLYFQPAFLDRGGNDVLVVQVPVRNNAPRQYLIDYRFLFYDEAGLELAPTMGWKMAALEPEQVLRLKANSLSSEAVRYRLELKWAR
jgi:uncharacterized protein YcfL